MTKNVSKKFNDSGFYIHKLKNKKAINDATKIILSSNHRSSQSDTLFDKESLKIQKILYDRKIHIDIFKKEFVDLKKILKIKSLTELMITSFFHLRAVRNVKSKKNILGFHRETFYSDYEYTSKQINISVPIMNYNKKNSLKVVAKSHLIPDDKIVVKKLSSKISKIKKNSHKHKLGLSYNPKEIISGVNLLKAKRVKLSVGQIIIFSSMLIHGNGDNNQKKIRYSIDFGIINKKFLRNNKIKKHHISYSKNKNYWTNLI